MGSGSSEYLPRMGPVGDWHSAFPHLHMVLEDNGAPARMEGIYIEKDQSRIQLRFSCGEDNEQNVFHANLH